MAAAVSRAAPGWGAGVTGSEASDKRGCRPANPAGQQATLLLGGKIRAFLAVPACHLRAMKLKAIIHEAEEGGYWAEVPALPGCVTQGETREELEGNLREAIVDEHHPGR